MVKGLQKALRTEAEASAVGTVGSRDESFTKKGIAVGARDIGFELQGGCALDELKDTSTR